LIGLDRGGKSIERRRPHRFQGEGKGSESGAIRPIEAMVAGAPNADEPGLTQDAEVLRHGAERHRHLRGDLAGTPLAVPDEAKDVATARLADHLKSIHGAILVAVETVCSAVYYSGD
jgi:hypothetical protein